MAPADGSIASSGGANISSDYTFRDQFGTEYPLVPAEDHWVCPLYAGLSWHPNISRLRFKDGSTWVFECVSGILEPDAGTLYPTRVLDTNGNYVEITYACGVGDSRCNTSSRISELRDVRRNNPTTSGSSYSFRYDAGPIPHLAGISSHVHTNETYDITFESLQLRSPFGPLSTLGTVLVPSVIRKSSNIAFGFGHSPAAELIRAQVQFGGEMSWQHHTVRFPDGRLIREVKARRVAHSSNNEQIDQFERPKPPGSIHSAMTIMEQGGTSSRTWSFCSDSASPAYGLLLSLEEPTRLTENEWRRTPSGVRYLGVHRVIRDGGTPHEASSRTEYVRDDFGNVVTELHFADANAVSPFKLISNRYLTDPRYTRAGIRDRLLSSTYDEGATSAEWRHYAYDTTDIVDRLSVDLHDYQAFGPQHSLRGNVTEATVNGAKRLLRYDVSGFLTEIEEPDGMMHLLRNLPAHRPPM